MFRSLSARTVANLGIASALALFLGACGSFSLPSLSSSPEPAQEPGVAPEMPATIRADEIVGRWGLASYQNPADRARTDNCNLSAHCVSSRSVVDVILLMEYLQLNLVIARSDSDEAIQFLCRSSGLLRGACHRAGHFGPDPLARNDNPQCKLGPLRKRLRSLDLTRTSMVSPSR